MTIKNTATKTTTKTKATGTKPVATPKKEKPKAIPKKEVPMPKPSTDVFSKEIVTELQTRTDKIKKSMGGIDKTMQSIAFDFYWIYDKKAYEAAGCDSITAYADKIFGYGKSTCYSFINVVERFAKRDENGNLLEEFDPSVKGYSISKLSLMTGLTDEQLKSLKPEMSVRDIKKFVKSLQGKAVPELPEGNAETDGETDNEGADDGALNEIFVRTLFTCNGFDEYNAKLDKIDETIHKLYKGMPDVSVKIVVERNGKPIEGKWGE